MEGQWEAANIHQEGRDRAEQIVNDALRVVMRGTSISPQDADCPRLRAQFAIRHIAHILWELSEAYELHADLKAALWDVSNGSEPALPDCLRQYWENREIPTAHEHAPPDKTQ
jgi:hypothetical protein